MRFERARGTRDFRPEEMEKRRWLEGVFRGTFRRYGYREVQTPTFEPLALFEEKSGPGVVKELYAFKDKADRDLCLRPELTAPVIRFYVNELTHEPKPLKVFYFGPCYRYEEPQEGRYREFWQFGLELIGPEGPAADAEAIAVALAALRAAGLRRFVLHVGHIGVLRALVGSLDAPAEAKADLYRRIDKDDPSLRDALAAAGAPQPLGDAIAAIAGHRRVVKPADASAVRRFFDDARAAVGRAMTPGIEAALSGLAETARLLAAYGVEEVELDLGVARGLDYYTGMVFELEAPDLGAQKQIGGGGAYTLAQLFGGEPVGTVGFGLGFDRILLALEKEGVVPPPAPPAEYYVVPVGEPARAPALHLAQRLREVGARVDVDLMGRGPGKAMQYASKLGIPKVVLLGEKELAAGTVTIKDMASGEQRNVPADEFTRAP